MCGVYHNPSADKSQRQAEKHQKRAENSGCSHFRKNEKACRIDSHHIHGVDLLGDSHASDLRRNVRSHLSGKNQRHHSGTELKNKTFPNHISDIHLIDDRVFKVRCCLDHKDSAYEYGDDAHQQDGRQYEFVCFIYELSPEDFPLLWPLEDHFHKEHILSYRDKCLSYHSISILSACKFIGFRETFHFRKCLYNQICHLTQHKPNPYKNYQRDYIYKESPLCQTYLYSHICHLT